ncbi:phosphoribosylformylglycinamidine synthase subunit PurQ [Candidatus Micrarchaeota archaeon]|nr:phosphoribosylformylglycinamidine synthase subunit PurQ [Candidatus Micrarchaeota archaeon]
MKAKAAVLYGYGINSDYETVYSIQAVGGTAERVHVHDIVNDPKLLEQYGMVVFPGGFAHGDDLGSGKVMANKFRFKLKENMLDFVNNGKLVLGICNGFQMIIKMGLVPYSDFEQRATLMANDSGKFEDRWVFMKMNQNSPCIFTKGIDMLMTAVRHGEGKLYADSLVLNDIVSKELVAATYVNERGEIAGYPYNPNGSLLNIAGICNPKGTVFGLMPHPEVHNCVVNNPYWTHIKDDVRDWRGSGLKIFDNAVRYLEEKF